MANKLNPRNVPCSKADVDRAEKKGMDLGMEFALNIVLFVLKDKHDAPNDDILQLRDEFMYVIDSVSRGYLTYSDIKAALKSDYDMSIYLTDR